MGRTGLDFCVVAFWLLMRNTAITPPGNGFCHSEKSEIAGFNSRPPLPLCDAGSALETATHCPLLALSMPPSSIVNSWWLLPAWQRATCTGPHGCCVQMSMHPPGLPWMDACAYVPPGPAVKFSAHGAN